MLRAGSVEAAVRTKPVQTYAVAASRFTVGAAGAPATTTNAGATTDAKPTTPSKVAPAEQIAPKAPATKAAPAR